MLPFHVKTEQIIKTAFIDLTMFVQCFPRYTVIHPFFRPFMFFIIAVQRSKILHFFTALTQLLFQEKR